MLTQVHILSHADKFEFSLRFGRSAEEQIINPDHRLVSFEPGEVFAFVHWQGEEGKTEHYGVDIVRAARAGEPFTCIPFVSPGGEILARVSGWNKVQAVIGAIESVEALAIPPEHAAPDYWRHVGNRVAAGRYPRPYAHKRHQAWLKRQRVIW